jgi:cation diffusion facilitator CzcD-associated flavoprotein CzcO
MLQRSPTYVVSRPAGDAISDNLRKFLPASVAYGLTRFKNTALQGMMFKRMRAKPDEAKAMLLKMVRDQMGPNYDVEKHFTPTYYPWDQRLCLVPDADLFKAIKDGRAEVVTDHIERFTKTGILLKSGQELPADIIVTATGLNLVMAGEMEFSVDGAAVDFSQTWTYKGMMYSGVPNLISTFGYINASWTLRADLIAEYACRVINLMDKKRATRVTPRLRAQDANMPARPWIERFSSGYMERFMAHFPKQGDREPWTNPQNYALEKKTFRSGALEDGALVFDDARGAAKPETAPVLQAAE